MQSPRYVAKYGAIRFLSCPGRAGIVSKFRAVSGTACKMPSPTPPKSAKVELIVERKMRWAMGCRNTQEVGLLKSPDLRIQGIAHGVEPGTGQIRVVPGLFRSAFVCKHRVERSRIPYVRIVGNHRARREVAPPRHGGKR